VTDKGKSSQVN